MTRREQRQRLAALISDEVLASDDPVDRADLLRELVRAVYEPTPEEPVAGGGGQTDERASMAKVLAQALDHKTMTSRGREPAPEPDHDVDRPLAMLKLARRDPSEWFQRQVARPLPFDDEATGLTRGQARKCGGILRIWAIDGNELWSDAGGDAVELLEVLAAPAGTIVPTPEQGWSRLADLPWPPPRRLRR